MKKTVSTTNRLSQAITNREGLLKEVEEVDRLPLNLVASHHQTLLTVDQVILTINGEQLFEPLSFKVTAHDQVALVGPNGAGKSSLIHAIRNNFAGEYSGKITLANGIKVSYVRQDYTTNHGLLKEFSSEQHIAYDLLLNILRKLGMERSTFNVPIEQMSMGQQKKVELARSLATPAQLYIWDEPLNYLDTYNQQQLIQLIKDYQPPLLFVEHDKHFIDTVAQQQVQVKIFPRK